MGRPSKSVEVQSKHLTKEERSARLETQNALKGTSDKIAPSSRLNSNQKKIFNYIVEQLDASNILGNLDVFLLEHTCIAIDRLQNIEKMINEDFARMFDRELMNSKTKYTADFLKGMEHLSLSPASRAKFGIISAEKKKQEQDPLLKVLKKVN